MKLTHSLVIFVALTATASLSRGSMLIQELFDSITTSDASLNGKGDGTTSLGMTGNWATNGSTGIFTANNFNLNGSTLPGLPSNAGGNGGVWNNTGSYGTNIYATRPLVSAINFSTTQEIFFSVRLRNPGDTSMGVGLAAGANGSAEMAGAGFTWDNQVGLDGQQDRNAAYITHGTLDQNLTGTNDGVYAVRAHEAANSVNTYGLLVGRITINATGNDVIEIKRYAENAVIDNDLSTITWGASSSVDSAMNATHLLLWMNGGGSGELDAIRFGTTWTDVTGVTLVDPSANSYWDVDGATAGAGGAAPSGNWSDASWSTSAAGDVATTTWTAGRTAVFAAGADATDPYTVSLSGSQSVASVIVQEGDVELTGGTLNLGAAGSLTAAPGAYLTVASGFSAADFSTSGNVFLNGANTVSGDLTINANTLTLGSALSVGGLSGIGNLNLAANTFTSTSAANSTYSGIISGSGGALVKSGAGILTLTGVSGYDGGTTINAGTLALTNFARPGTGAIQIDAPGTYAFSTTGSNQPAFSNAVSGAGAFTVTGGVGNQSFWSGDWSGFSGTLTINPAASIWARSSSNTGSPTMKVILSGNWGLYNNESATTRTYHMGELTGAATARIWGEPDTTNAVTLSVGALDTSTTFAGVIANNWSGNSTSTMGLTKVGVGSFTLSGVNTYTGDTTVSGGILAVNGNSIANIGKLVIDGGKVAPTGTETVDTLNFGAVQQASGTWGATGSGATHVDDLHFSGIDGVVSVTTAPGINYATWIGTFPGAAGAPGFNQDADNDGITNGIEQILGTDPSVSSSGLNQVSATANSVTFRHTQTNEQATDVTKSYEWTTDLIEWKSSGVANAGGTTGTIAATTVTDNVAPANDIIEVVLTASGTPTTKLFVRLVANQ